MFTRSLPNTAEQLENTLLEYLKKTDLLISHFENLLAKEEADADRLFLIEDLGIASGGATFASGTIDLTRKINQPGIVTTAICSIQPIAAVTGNLIIDRFSIPIQSIQTRPLIITPLQYLIGPGKKVQMTWAGATDNIQPYFAVFGYLVGSKFTK